MAALLAACVLTACFRDDVAGGDDFPNSVETLGKAAAREASDTASWNAYDEAPEGPPEAYESGRAPDAPPEEEASALGRHAGIAAVGADGRVEPGFEIAGAVRSVFSLFDSLTGLTRAIRVQTLADVVVRDTTYFRLESLPPLRRMVRMSGAVTYAGRTEYFAFDDADGDGLLTPVGARSRARARFTVVDSSGGVERREVVFTAGADGRFEAGADNALASMDVVGLRGADTVLRLVVAPVPGDSVVRDPQRAFTHADVEHMTLAGGVRVADSYRARLHGDASRNRALRFRRVVTTAAGVTETAALGRDSAADFAPGDTGRVRVTFTAAASSDSLASWRADYRVVLADSTSGHGANRLLDLERGKVYRAGAEAAVWYRFVPDAPRAPGASLRAGDVAVRVDLRAGGWIRFAGTSSSTGFQGTWTDDAGRSGAIRYDGNGDPVTGSDAAL